MSEIVRRIEEWRRELPRARSGLSIAEPAEQLEQIRAGAGVMVIKTPGGRPIKINGKLYEKLHVFSAEEALAIQTLPQMIRVGYLRAVDDQFQAQQEREQRERTYDEVFEPVIRELRQVSSEKMRVIQEENGLRAEVEKLLDRRKRLGKQQDELEQALEDAFVTFANGKSPEEN